MTLGFSDKANLDEGAMWPTAFALTELTAAEEARIDTPREESRKLRRSRPLEGGEVAAVP